MVIFPSTALAAWWNPLTWKIFNKTQEIKETLPSPEIDVTIIEPEPLEKIVEPTAVKLETPPQKEPPILPAAKLEATVSEEDKAKITSVVYGFMIAVTKKDGATANSFVSDKSKIYFDSLLNSARTTPKDELLKKDFTTIATVIMIRLAPDSTALEIKGSDIIPQAVAVGTSTWLSSPDFFNLGLTFKLIDDNTVFVSSKSSGDISVNLTVIKEKGGWKIDYVPTIAKENAIIEKQLAKTSKETGRTREETMESLLQLFLGRFNAELDYRLWVPLNMRGELNVDNAKFKSISDPANGWSILYPDYWTIEFVESTTFFMAPYTTDGFRPSIAITPNHKPMSTKLDKYADYILEELPKVKKDILSESIESKKATFNGVSAYHIAYDRMRTFDGGRTYIKQVTDSFVFLNKGIAYMVEYRNGIADFDKTKPLADKILGTFQFEELCTKNCIVTGRTI